MAPVLITTIRILRRLLLVVLLQILALADQARLNLLPLCLVPLFEINVLTAADALDTRSWLLGILLSMMSKIANALMVGTSSAER